MKPQQDTKQGMLKRVPREQIKAMFRLSDVEYTNLVYEIGCAFIVEKTAELSDKVREHCMNSKGFWDAYKWRFEEINDEFIAHVIKNEMFRESSKKLLGYYKHCQLNFSHAGLWLNTSIILKELFDKNNPKIHKQAKKR